MVSIIAYIAWSNDFLIDLGNAVNCSSSIYSSTVFKYSQQLTIIFFELNRTLLNQTISKKQLSSFYGPLISDLAP